MSASGFSLPTNESGPTELMRPSSTSTAPSLMGGEETGMRVPPAKITGWPSGIPPDHLRGHRLQELAFRAVGQEGKVREGNVDLAPRPRLGPGDSTGGKYGLYAGLQQLGRWARVREDAPDRRPIPFLERKDDGQRHGTLDEICADALAHEAGLAHEVHYVVGHLEGDAEGLAVTRQGVYLHEREPTQGRAGHACDLKKTRGLLPYMFQIRLDLDVGTVRAELLQFPGSEPHGGHGEGAHEPGVPDPGQLGESLGEEEVPRGGGDLTPVLGDRGRSATPALGPVHDVVVDQGRRVQHLDGGGRLQKIISLRLAHVRA